MAPSLLLYFISMVLGTYYVASCIFTFIIFIASAVLVLAYTRFNYKLIVALRIVIFAFTLLSFFVMFIDDIIFNDAIG